MKIVAVRDTVLPQIKAEIDSYLSEQERARYHSLSDRARDDWLAGRVALKCAHIAAHGLPGSSFPQIEVSNRDTGQPYIAGYEHAFCSLGHSHGWGVAADAFHPVGVDIEMARERPTALMRRIASQGEVGLVRAGEDDTALIAKLWTVKEAVLKGLGTGLGIGPSRVKITDRENGGTYGVQVEKPDAPNNWRVWTTREDRFYIGVAFPAQYDEQPRIHWYHPTGL